MLCISCVFVITALASAKSLEQNETSTASTTNVTDSDKPRYPGYRTSMLTVEWVSIPGLEYPIKGYQVEYRREGDVMWHRYRNVLQAKSNVEPFKYRVRIKHLPAGYAYETRIVMLDLDNRPIYYTPSIPVQTIDYEPQGGFQFGPVRAVLS